MTEALLTSGLFGRKSMGKFWNLFFIPFQVLETSFVGLALFVTSQRLPIMHFAGRWEIPYHFVESVL